MEKRVGKGKVRALIEKLEVLSEIAQAEEDIKRKRVFSSKQVLERFKAKAGK